LIVELYNAKKRQKKRQNATKRHDMPTPAPKVLVVETQLASGAARRSDIGLNWQYRHHKTPSQRERIQKTVLNALRGCFGIFPRILDISASSSPIDMKTS
jgi:hypothetical protein